MRQPRVRTYSSRTPSFVPSKELVAALDAIEKAGPATAARVLRRLDPTRGLLADGSRVIVDWDQLQEVKARREAERRAALGFAIDEPDRPGGIRWHRDEDGEPHPERIHEDANPHDLARETQKRRQERQRSGPPFEVPGESSMIASADPGEVIVAGSLKALMLEVRETEARWRAERANAR